MLPLQSGPVSKSRHLVGFLPLVCHSLGKAGLDASMQSLQSYLGLHILSKAVKTGVVAVD